jgi:hypothetical protein
MYRRQRYVMMIGIIGPLIAVPPFQSATARAQYGHGSVVGWGSVVVGGNLSADCVAVAGGGDHSLRLKADGSIVTWGSGPGDPLAPNTGFVAIAAGDYSLAIKGCILGDLDCNGDVDLADLAELLGVYGTCEGNASYDPDADFDHSGCIGLADLAALLSKYGLGT